MILKQAVNRLAALGFKMDAMGRVVHGVIGAEAFSYAPHDILSEPMRDVYVCETANGWHVTSHINFKGKRHRHTDTHYATILNIFGSGSTLREAMEEFELHVLSKTYRQYDTICREGAIPNKPSVVNGMLRGEGA
jgi:hypothetical protein